MKRIFLLFTILIFIEGCKNDEGDTVKVTGITLVKSELTLLLGNSGNMVARIEPKEASNKRINWTSSNQQVATINEDGIISTVGAGVTIIKATTLDGNYSATCMLTVEEDDVVHAGSVILNVESMTLNVNTSYQLEASVYPLDAVEDSVIWSSDNKSVVSVDDFGVITALEEGEATITVTTFDGGKTDKCDIIVNIPVAHISLSRDVVYLIEGGMSSAVEVIFEPENASNREVEWYSPDLSIVKITEGASTTFDPVGKGSTHVIAISEDDVSKKVSCPVFVYEPVKNVIPVATSNGTNITCSGVAEDLPDYQQFHAFDGNGSTLWRDYLENTPWIAYEFDEEIYINNYTIEYRDGGPKATPSVELNIKFEALDDEGKWVLLDSRNNVENSKTVLTKSFTFFNESAYKKYRITFSTVNNGRTEVELYTLNFGRQPIIMN